MKSIAVVGASLAGLRAVETLRSEGFDGDLHLVGDEVHRPYDRPPLSKQILSGDWDVERIWLTAEEKFDELDLKTNLGDAAVSFDAATLAVTLASGLVLDVDGVVIATGARAMVPPIPGLRETGVRTNETLFELTELPPRGNLALQSSEDERLYADQCQRYPSRATSHRYGSRASRHSIPPPPP